MAHNITRHLLTIAAAISAATVSAQELNESMTVHGAYDPVIRHHERISGLPERLQLPLPEASLPLATDPVRLTIGSHFHNAGHLAHDASLPENRRGYLDMQAGSYFNTTVSAGLRVLHNETTMLSLWLQHNSTSLYRANEISPYRRRYDESIGARFTHSFSPGTLSVAATYHLAYFNYYRAVNPWGHDTPAEMPDMPGTQTINDIAVSADWKGSSVSSGVFYSAGASYRYFGMRRLYEWRDFTTYTSLKGSRENDASLNACVGYRVNPASAFSLDMRARLIGYTEQDLSTAGFYTITPAYTLNLPSVKLRVGARVDITSSITGDIKFDTFHAAPDVALHLTASRFSLSLSATGGVRPNTLSSAHKLCYYSTPLIASTIPVYTPIDTRLRLGFGNFSGISAGIYAGYAVSRNTPLEGTYPLYLFNQLITPVSYLITPRHLDIHGFSMGADLQWAYGSLLSAEADLSYTPQRGSRGAFNGIDRPRWVLNTEATVRPLTGLSITLGYDYRGVRKLYYRSEPQSALSSQRLPDLYNLHASAAYTFASRYTVGISAQNILGANAWICPEMPQEGFSLAGRVAILF